VAQSFVIVSDATSDGTLTIRLRSGIGAGGSGVLYGALMEALRPDTRRVVLDLSSARAVDGGLVAEALVRVEEALADEACLLEVRGASGPLAALLDALGLARHDDRVTAADVEEVDRLLADAGGPVGRHRAAMEAVDRLIGPDMGNTQAFDSSDGSLTIVDQRGFRDPFLEFFERVRGEKGAACGAAMERGGLVVVEDVTRSPVFLGTPSLDVLLEAGVRAVESMPFHDPTGRLAGVVSVHHRTSGPRRRHELLLLRLVAARLGAHDR